MRKRPHSIHPLAATLGGEHRARSVPPAPPGPLADVDAALMQAILDAAQPERVADPEHHRQADAFGARLDVPEREALGPLASLGATPILLKASTLTTPSRKWRMSLLLSRAGSPGISWAEGFAERCHSVDFEQSLVRCDDAQNHDGDDIGQARKEL